jgi:hypothetical protein
MLFGAPASAKQKAAGKIVGRGCRKKPLALTRDHLYPKPMRFRFLLSLLVVAAFAGCESPYKKSDAEDKKEPLKNQVKDPTFLAFIGRLKIAVAKKDRAMIASMMTGDFGYRWDNPPPGETMFDYWDKHNLWGELGNILRSPFVAHDRYLVAPPQVMSDPSYQGYRVGMRTVHGAWRFAYFVPGEPEGAAAPEPSAPALGAPPNLVPQ